MTLVITGGLLLVGSVVGAATMAIDDAASVGQVARRVPPPGLLFPMDARPKCLIFNNFGGTSGVYGAGGHQGVDIGADLGQAVYAVEDGELYKQWTDTGSAGLGWGLVSDDGTQYRYFHLSGFAEGLETGDRVTTGQVIGYVGDTGNATKGGYHLHFEVRPEPGNAPVDPVPLLAANTPANCVLYPKR